MSGPDQDDDKGFLARWSQRKQEAKQPEPTPDAPAPAAEIPPAPVAEAEAAEEFDLSSLPKLEEMTGATDITGFLQKGVPEHLRNAALRKSWALDPAIRNYVNPALEYAYDWNTPGGVPGTSEISAGMDVARMVLQIMGDGPAAEPVTSAAKSEKAPGDPEPTLENVAAPAPEPGLPGEALRLSDDAAISSAQNVSVETHPSEEAPAAPQQPVRRHGSAKPTV
ncbi:MAG: DUF3306 domain-containing protein [Bradyrhizobium sp.]|uniref:DUF3306 domain-containing protein n=1 Tax=Bradyrhizobium sp. TaxID=376 RepID=UPI00271C0EF6|nr:DUF3306 domain-containing protein [Bradyrhizobium sp.]MDO8398144.1 DUF3306 domain-containing protein [Bradyrhizobium sp.]